MFLYYFLKHSDSETQITDRSPNNSRGARTGQNITIFQNINKKNKVAFMSLFYLLQAAMNNSTNYKIVKPNMVENKQFRTVSGVLMEVLSFTGFIANILVLFALVKCKEVKKDPAIILVMNLIVTDICQLFLIVSHVGIEELVPSIEWGLYQEIVPHAMTSLWYSSLFTIFSISLTRYFAVLKHFQYKQTFTFSRTVNFIFFQWTLALTFAILPFFGICCDDIFDVQTPSDYASMGNSFNILKLFVLILSACLFVWILFAYSRVIFKLRKQANKIFVHVSTVNRQVRNIRAALQAQNQTSSPNSDSKRKKNWRVTLQLIIISISYMNLIISWFSCEIFGRTSVTVSLERFAYCIDSSVVPVTFFILNPDLRSVLNKILFD